MSQDRSAQASRWHQAQLWEDMDWDGFTLWLEADPRNRLCYDAIVDLDDRLTRYRITLRALIPQDRPASRFVALRWVGASFAAAASLAAAFLLIPGQAPRDMRFATAFNQRRTISLGDRVIVRLDPGSVLTAGGHLGDPLTLDGHAYFSVRHDAAHPLIVHANGFEIRDVGTRFEVITAKGALRVAVAEGSVNLHSVAMSQDLSLLAGHAMSAIGTSGLIETRVIDASTMGRLSRDHLEYHEVPLAFVVADISRLVGAPVEVDPISAHRRFSGSLSFGTRTEMTEALKELMDLDARSDGPTLRLSVRRVRSD
jgi:transmembrane sensor